MTRRHPIAIRFGETLRYFRRSREYTLPTLEKASGLSRGLLSKLENGTGNPSLLTLHRLARALRVGVGELIA